MIVRTVGMAWLIICVSGALWFAHMTLDTTPPYVYDAVNSKIVPDPAPQGATITADWSLSKVNRLCPGSVQRFFRNADTGRMIATLDTTPVSRGVQTGDNRLPRAFQLPPNLPPRVAYSALVCFECNFLQAAWKPLCIRTPEIRFSVIQ